MARLVFMCCDRTQGQYLCKKEATYTAMHCSPRLSFCDEHSVEAAFHYRLQLLPENHSDILK